MTMVWMNGNAVQSVMKSSRLAAQTEMENKYLVATGAIVFTQIAPSAREALLLVKERLRAAYDVQPSRHDPGRLSRTLLESFANGKLDFVVMDGERTRLICGEFKGIFEQPVTRRLSDSLKHLIPVELETKRRWASRTLLATPICRDSIDNNAEPGLCA